MRTSWLLILLALPSLIGSVLLMRLAGVGQSLLIQQIALALLGMTCVLWIDNARRNQDAGKALTIPRQVRNSVLILVPMLIGLAACFAFSEAGNSKSLAQIWRHSLVLLSYRFAFGFIRVG